MGDVVVMTHKQCFSEPQELVWACICGCTHFFIVEDGSVRCVECDTYSTNIAHFDPNAKF